jgi:hypothetical protein
MTPTVTDRIAQALAGLPPGAEEELAAEIAQAEARLAGLRATLAALAFARSRAPRPAPGPLPRPHTGRAILPDPTVRANGRGGPGEECAAPPPRPKPPCSPTEEGEDGDALGIPRGALTGLMRHEWFEREADG